MKVSYLPSRMIQPLLANGKSALFVVLNDLKECDFIGGMLGKPLCYGSRISDFDTPASCSSFASKFLGFLHCVSNIAFALSKRRTLIMYKS